MADVIASCANPSPATMEAAAAAIPLMWSRNQYGMMKAPARNGFSYSIVHPSRHLEGWKAYLERNVQGEYRGIEITTTAASEADAQRICNLDAVMRTDWRPSRDSADESRVRPGPVSSSGTGIRGLALGYSHPQEDPPGLYPSVDL